MEKKDIHLIGFLSNVDDSILKLDLGQPFTIEKISQGDAISFIRNIREFYGTESDNGILAIEDRVNGIVHDQSFYYYCVMARNIESFESTPQGGVVIRYGALENIVEPIRNKLRLLRLFKEGNILLLFSLLYHLVEDKPRAFSFCREWPLTERTVFKLKDDNEVSCAHDFINKVKIPFDKEFLRLAFESFELSYETHSAPLNFLSLMISLETLLNPSDKELRYRISRNVAVLLGKDTDDSERIFKEVREMYDKRSELVHTGSANKVSPKDVFRLRYYVRETIKEMQAIGRDKEDILKILNACGFGQRPWRNE
ncbi:MAG: hypothetical protein ABSG22_01035 [Sedimentisphaerales bacterium]